MKKVEANRWNVIQMLNYHQVKSLHLICNAICNDTEVEVANNFYLFIKFLKFKIKVLNNQLLCNIINSINPRNILQSLAYFFSSSIHSQIIIMTFKYHSPQNKISRTEWLLVMILDGGIMHLFVRVMLHFNVFYYPSNVHSLNFPWSMIPQFQILIPFPIPGNLFGEILYNIYMGGIGNCTWNIHWMRRILGSNHYHCNTK